jgi:hypothetical protein
MYQFKDEFWLRCGCGYHNHIMVFSYDEHDYHIKNDVPIPRTHDLIIQSNVEYGTFLERIKNAIMFIFKKNKLFSYGDLYFNLNDNKDKKELEKMVNFVNKQLNRNIKK